MQIRTLPVYSKLAEQIPSELASRVPVGWQLSEHQVETYRALTGNEYDVVINTAITGDGKSLGGQLPALVNGWKLPLFAMYPTNELIRDQLRQAEKTWRFWQQPSMKVILDSSTLDRLMESGDYKQRGDALSGELRNHDFVLTNPDIFHYIVEMYYVRTGQYGDAPDKVFSLLKDFHQFTFDEFHIFETPQVVSVINALLLIAETTKGYQRRFLFQSATPNEMLLTYLQRAGFRTQVVEGRYEHRWHAPSSAEWRQILQGSDIYFYSNSMETWLDEHLDDILIPFFRSRSPAVKGAIIINSVAQATRITQRLKRALQPYNISVESNTGLTGRERRAASYAADILVGTSTVDVGVDFQINFLLFESRDAGSFLQRLGRLGRHAFYERNGTQVSFEGVFQAHALLPTWINTRLFEAQVGTPAPLSDGGEVDRQTLAKIINAAFPPVADYRGYAKSWGILQSIKVAQALRNPTIRDSYAATYQSLTQRYEGTFDVQFARYFARYKTLYTEQRKLFEEAISFRGSSYFDCGLFDPSERDTDQIKEYDLLALLPNAELLPLDEVEFWEMVKRLRVPEAPLQRKEFLGFFRLGRFKAERENFRIKLQHDIGDWGGNEFGSVRLLTGITIEHELPAIVPGLNAINRKLQQRQIPALICRGVEHPLEIKRRLRLPMLFPIYSMVSLDNLRGVIAFGRQALLLEVVLRHSGVKCDGDAAIIL